MKTLLLLLLVSCVGTSYTQVPFNGDLEKIDRSTKRPAGWVYAFNKAQETAYEVRLDSGIKQKGKYALSIEKRGKEAEFGVVSYIISKAFEGKEIELRGFLKTENVASGYAGLWMRIDGSQGKGQLAFDNMGKRGIKGTTDWKQYTIKLPYQSGQAMVVNIGGLFVGDGKAWFDNFELFIDGTPIDKAKIKMLKKAETDTAFAKGSGIAAIKSDSQTIGNLVLAGQFWGFLKYHHPSVANGDYNWDAELFRLLPKVLKANNNQELSTVLETYLDLLPVPSLCKNCMAAPQREIALKPDYGQLFDGTILNKSLINKLAYIRKNTNFKEHHYLSFVKSVGNPVFTNENAYPLMTYPDPGYRLLSLFRYWSMINYFFPYKNQIGEDWNKVLRSSLPEFINAGNEQDYSLAVLKIIARVHDTHANIWGENKALNDFKGKYAAPIQVKFIEGVLVVTGFYSDTLATKEKVLVGDIILAVNGKSIEQQIKEYLPYTAASNYDTQLRDLPKILY